MGLKESKKYAIGSIHENGGGKFEILERWYDEDSNTVMLKYKYEDGKIETNKEVNVNASEWKWRKVRGLAGKASIVGCLPKEEVEDKFELLTEKLEEGVKAIMANNNGISQLRDAYMEQHKMLVEILAVIKVQQKEIDSLLNDRELINKLLEKI